jgi:heptosyltransferase-1
VKALLVKTSSLGDVVHALPAVTDAVRAVPGLRFDWVVEDAFAEIPALHPGVARVIPIALRRWRGHWVAALRDGEVDAFVRDLRRERYDVVIDAQGLVKSALPALAARGPAAGLGLRSAREPLASLLYRRRYAVPRVLHAIERIRRLLALALHYELPEGEPEYGFQPIQLSLTARPYVVFLHGTTWASKHYPEAQWIELATLVGEAGYEVRYPWATLEERLRAERIAAKSNCGRLLPRLSLRQLAEKIAGAAGVVGVDTGLSHLAAALGVPAVTLYGPTQAGLTGTVGPHQRNLEAEFPCAPCMRRDCRYRGESDVHPACFATLPAQAVWRSLTAQMQRRRGASARDV